MLIFAPSTKQQRNDDSIQECIRDRIEATFSGDIAYLYDSAMAVNRLSQNSRSTSSSNRCAQRAADSDDYRTAVARACSSQTIATIGPSNISHVNKLYTPPVPDRLLGVVHANVGQNVTRAGPSFSFFCTKSYIRRSRDVTRREPQHHTNRQNRQKHRHHGGRAALLSSDVESMDQRDRTCGRPVHGIGRGRG